MRVLFWNINKNENIHSPLAEIIQEQNIDFVIIAEQKNTYPNLYATLNSLGLAFYKYPNMGCNDILFMGRAANQEIEIGASDTRYCFYIIKNKYILCALHLPSRMYDVSGERRQINIFAIKKEFEELKVDTGIDKCIIVGDFNDDPFDSQLTSAINLFALPFCFPNKNNRTFESHTYFPFYNPMWNLFGDFNHPPGTYYYNESSPNGTYWHIFDQVLISPSLQSSFINDSLQILTNTTNHNLLNNIGYPNSKLYSDHLPIIFEIKED